jgi:zinc transporter 5/7
MLFDFNHVTFRAPFSDILFGYLALACSIFFIPAPLPEIEPASQPTRRTSVMSPTPTTPNQGPPAWSQPASSSLVATAADINLTLVSGIIMFSWTLFISFFLGVSPFYAPSSLIFSTLAILSSTAAFLYARPSTLQSERKAGVGLTCFLLAIVAFLFSPSLWPGTICNGGLSALSFIGVLYDTSAIAAHRSHDEDIHEHAHNAHARHHDNDGSYSVLTRYLMGRCEPGSLMYGILGEKDSRRIAYFTW